MNNKISDKVFDKDLREFLNSIKRKYGNDKEDIINVALVSASKIGRLDLVKLLVEYGADEYIEPVAQACRERHLEIVKYLTNLEKFDIKKDLDDKCIFYACIGGIFVKDGNIEIIKLILDKGATVKGKNNLAITRAVFHLEILKLFIELGADVTVHHNLTMQLVIYSCNHDCYGDRLEIVKLLLNYGGYVTKRMITDMKDDDEVKLYLSSINYIPQFPC